MKDNMTSQTRAKLDTIAQLLTEAISDTAESVAGEACHPGNSVDDSDDLIASGRKLVAKLRSMRTQVEDLTLEEYL